MRAETTITLDGSGSYDPDGNLDSYHWRISMAPQASTANLVATDRAVTTFTPDLPGSYTFVLEVTDLDGNASSSAVMYYAVPAPLVISAGVDVAVQWRDTVQLVGTYTLEGAETPTIAWTFVSRPARSKAALQGATGLTPSFRADADGTYVVQLDVSSPTHHRTDTVTVVATALRIPFDGAFIAAEFEPRYDHLLAISDGPPRFRLIRPQDGTELTISLPATPTDLSMDQYNNQVVVATMGSLVVIDVFAGTVDAVIPISFSCANVVFGSLGKVHCFPTQAGPIETIDLATGVVQPTTQPVSGGMAATLQSGQYALYGIDASFTPPDLVHYNDADFPVVLVGDSPYSGEYTMGNELWTSGDSIYTSTGNVFGATPFGPMDMVFRGHLGGEEPAEVRSVYRDGYTLQTLHAPPGGPTTPNDQFRVYDDTSYALIDAAPIPDILVNGVPQASAGRLLGYSPSYPNKVVIVASAGASNAFIVTTP